MADGELAAGDDGAEKGGGVAVGKDMMGQRELEYKQRARESS